VKQQKGMICECFEKRVCFLSFDNRACSCVCRDGILSKDIGKYLTSIKMRVSRCFLTLTEILMALPELVRTKRHQDF
jgi:hypothetical protein